MPPSPLSCLKYNPKNSDTILGGSHNGTICFFDLRKQQSRAPAGYSVVENSHQDPVSDVFWISSKTGHQCASVSTDGQMLWWDTRKLEEGPIDKLVLSTDSKRGDGVTLGGSRVSRLEYSRVQH